MQNEVTTTTVLLGFSKLRVTRRNGGNLSYNTSRIYAPTCLSRTFRYKIKLAVAMLNQNPHVRREPLPARDGLSPVNSPIIITRPSSSSSLKIHSDPDNIKNPPLPPITYLRQRSRPTNASSDDTNFKIPAEPSSRCALNNKEAGPSSGDGDNSGDTMLKEVFVINWTFFFQLDYLKKNEDYLKKNEDYLKKNEDYLKKNKDQLKPKIMCFDFVNLGCLSLEIPRNAPTPKYMACKHYIVRVEV
uniref:Uncharacterized protein n=1 Tax=Beta vulgaris TaxID=161934 RepID=K4Q1W3_BETVU|nr:hypothetical protein [Beta vulgaris]